MEELDEDALNVSVNGMKIFFQAHPLRFVCTEFMYCLRRHDGKCERAGCRKGILQVSRCLARELAGQRFLFSCRGGHDGKYGREDKQKVNTKVQAAMRRTGCNTQE